jgi:hypothetical protein
LQISRHGEHNITTLFMHQPGSNHVGW